MFLKERVFCAVKTNRAAQARQIYSKWSNFFESSDFYMYSIIDLVEIVLEVQNEFYSLYLRH